MMTNSFFIFVAVVVTLLAPIIGWVVCAAKINSLMRAYLSPTQIRILDWQAKKPTTWKSLSNISIILFIGFKQFLPKPIGEFGWYVLVAYVIVTVLVQYLNPCSDLPKVDFAVAFIQRLKFLRRTQLALIIIFLLMLLGLIGVVELIAPTIKP